MVLKSHQVQMPRPPAFDETLGAALSFAKYDGIPVFACCPQTKKPFTANGFKDATTDEQLIEKMWKRWPAAMIGMPTGPVSSRWVLDIDVKDGRDGRATLAALEREHGALPPTLTTLTPSGGEHRFFRWEDEHPIGSRVALGAGLDTRGAGGYVILPPSMREDGACYYWAPTCTEIVAAPAWLITHCVNKPNFSLEGASKPIVPTNEPLGRGTGEHSPVDARTATPSSNGSSYARAALEAEIGALAATLSGGRNNRLNIASLKLHQLVAAGVLDEDEVVERLLQACHDNGLIADDGEDTVRATIASGANKGKEEPRAIPKPSPRRWFQQERQRQEEDQKGSASGRTTGRHCARACSSARRRPALCRGLGPVAAIQRSALGARGNPRHLRPGTRALSPGGRCRRLNRRRRRHPGAVRPAVGCNDRSMGRRSLAARHPGRCDQSADGRHVTVYAE